MHLFYSGLLPPEHPAHNRTVQLALALTTETGKRQKRHLRGNPSEYSIFKDAFLILWKRLTQKWEERLKSHTEATATERG